MLCLSKDGMMCCVTSHQMLSPLAVRISGWSLMTSLKCVNVVSEVVHKSAGDTALSLGSLNMMNEKNS